MGKLKNYSISITTTGSAGSATGSGSMVIENAILRQVHVDYHASAPSTTDLTIAFGSPFVGNILVLTNTNTDGVYQPRLRAVDNSSSTANVNYSGFYINGKITFAIADADALTGCANIILIVEELE